jgi:transcription antitermination factor NusG
MTFVLANKSPTSYLLFPTIKKVKISVGEMIGVKLSSGEDIVGKVSNIDKDKKHFSIKTESKIVTCFIPLDQVIKLF